MLEIIDKSRALRLLCSLPKKYIAFVNFMVYGMGMVKKLSNMKGNLHSELLAGRLAILVWIMIQKFRMFAKLGFDGEGRSSFRSQSRGPNIMNCYYRMNHGHFVARCPKLERKIKNLNSSISTSKTSVIDVDTTMLEAKF